MSIRGRSSLVPGARPPTANSPKIAGLANAQRVSLAFFGGMREFGVAAAVAMAAGGVCRRMALCLHAGVAQRLAHEEERKGQGGQAGGHVAGELVQPHGQAPLRQADQVEGG